MTTFMLILSIVNPSGEWDTYVIDFNLSRGDCEDVLLDYDIHDNPLVQFTCEPELTK